MGAIALLIATADTTSPWPRIRWQYGGRVSMDWWSDLEPPEDFDPYEDCTTNKGKWITECRANRHHKCVRRSVYCPGEICPGEIYERTAVLERPLGPRKKGTVTVFRACQTCMHHA